MNAKRISELLRELANEFERADVNSDAPIVPPTKRTNTAERVKYPGIFEAARELGVDRMHLYFVLRGDRKSKRIQASDYYRRMVGERAE